MKVTVWKRTIKLSEVNFTGITLLSKEEFENNKDLIPNKNWSYWLREPGLFASQRSPYIIDYVKLELYNIVHNVRPVLTYKDSDLEPGDIINLAGYTWTVLRDGLILCDESIGTSCFREDLVTADACDYEKSDVKKFVESWAEKHNIINTVSCENRHLQKHNELP